MTYNIKTCHFRVNADQNYNLYNMKGEIVIELLKMN